MQLFRYATLTLCQQQHTYDVLLPPKGKQSHLSKRPSEEDGKISEEYKFNTKLLRERAKVCDLDLKSRHEWICYRKQILNRNR